MSLKSSANIVVEEKQVFFGDVETFSTLQTEIPRQASTKRPFRSIVYQSASRIEERLVPVILIFVVVLMSVLVLLKEL